MGKNYFLQGAKLLLLASLGFLMKNQELNAQWYTKTDLNLSWAKVAQPARVDGQAQSHIVTDSKGNVYQFFTATHSFQVGSYPCGPGDWEQSFAALVKYQPDGTFEWQQTIKGLKTVTANAITIDGNSIYLVGSYDTDKGKKTELVISGRNKTTRPEDLSSSKDAQDLYIAKYSLEGEVQAFKAIKSLGQRVETPNSILVDNGQVYICGESSGKGINPEYGGFQINSGDPAQPEKLNSFAFVFKLRASDLTLSKVSTIKPTEGTVKVTEEETWKPDSNGNWQPVMEKVYQTTKDRIILKSLVAIDGRVFVVGSSDAESRIYFNYFRNGAEKWYFVNTFNENSVKEGDYICPDKAPGFEDYKCSRNGIILAEVDTSNGGFKSIKSYSKYNATVHSATVAGNNLYLGLNISAKTTSTYNGAAILKVNSSQIDFKKTLNPQLYAIGHNDELNVVKSLLVIRDQHDTEDIILFGGDYNGTLEQSEFNISEKGDGDSFLGSLKTSNGTVKKLSSIGCESIEELQSIAFSGQNIYFSGYYRGNEWPFEDIEKPEHLDGRFTEKYYVVCLDANAEGFRAVNGSAVNKNGAKTTAVEKLNNVQAFSVVGNTITWNVTGRFTIFAIDGSIVEQGQARQGAATTLNRGNVYIIKLNGKVTKIIL